MTAMQSATNGRGRRRVRVVVLTVVLIMLVVAFLSDLGQDARDWVADLWNGSARAETVLAPSDSTGAVDAASAAGTALTRPLSSLPDNADGTLAIAAYRGQAAAAGQPR